MPPMEAFPKSHIVTFKYYVGLIHFLDEDYVIVCSSLLSFQSGYNLLTLVQAEQNLTSAYRLCHRHANRNKESVFALSS